MINSAPNLEQINEAYHNSLKESEQKKLLGIIPLEKATPLYQRKREAIEDATEFAEGNGLLPRKHENLEKELARRGHPEDYVESTVKEYFDPNLLQEINRSPERYPKINHPVGTREIEEKRQEYLTGKIKVSEGGTEFAAGENLRRIADSRAVEFAENNDLVPTREENLARDSGQREEDTHNTFVVGTERLISELSNNLGTERYPKNALEALKKQLTLIQEALKPLTENDEPGQVEQNDEHFTSLVISRMTDENPISQEIGEKLIQIRAQAKALKADETVKVFEKTLMRFTRKEERVGLLYTAIVKKEVRDRIHAERLIQQYELEGEKKLQVALDFKFPV